MSSEFLELIASAQSDADVEIVVDTNVVVEIDSIGDILREFDRAGSTEAWMASPQYRYRQLRARHSVLLAWWLASTGIPVGVHGNELVELMTNRMAPAADRTSHAYMFTTAIVHIIRPYVLRGLKTGALLHLDHHALRGAADDELLRVAREGGYTFITNEGNVLAGITEWKGNGQRNLRGRCVDAGVPVFTPEEFLVSRSVDVGEAAREFLRSCDAGIRRAVTDGVLMDTALGRYTVDHLYPVYRWMMLNEVSEKFEHLNRHPVES